MEQAACAALNLNTSDTTVGTGISTSHLTATALGATITATATVTLVKGSSLTFNIEAVDSTGATIGKGTHTRAIVNAQRFMDKLAKRSNTQ